MSNRLDELEQIRAEQRENEEDSPTPSSEDSVISASSSDQSSSSSLGEHQPADANKSVEDMDLSNDDQNNDNAEHLEQKNLDDYTSPALPTKMVHSRSEGDLSLEEERAKAYNQKNQENNNNGTGGGITSSESFNNFLYWREPLPVLDDIPDVDAIDNNDEKSNTEKESESKDDETPSTSSEGEDGAKDEQKGNDSIYGDLHRETRTRLFFFILFWGFFFFREAKAHDQLTHDGVAVVLMD